MVFRKVVIFLFVSFILIPNSTYADELSVESQDDVICTDNASKKKNTLQNGFIDVWCESPLGERIGQRKLLYPSGKVYIDSVYCEGKICGKWRVFYEDGVLMTEGLYLDGKPNGDWVNYHSNGKKSSEGKFKSGCKEGVWIFFDVNGAKISKVEYIAGGCKSGVIQVYKSKSGYSGYEQTGKKKKKRRGHND